MVVESVSARVTTPTNTLTITKPTGLAVGDLLVAVLATYTGDSAGAGTISLKSGWTNAITTDFLSNELTNSIQYKIADSADVAAANFAFTRSTSTDVFEGYLVRASGQNSMNPLGHASAYSNASANSANFAGTLTEYTPGVDGALVLVQVNTKWVTGGSVRSVSAYAATNVSFTEGFDDYSSDGGGGTSAAAAHGIQSTNAAISTYTATLSISTPEHYGHIVVFLPPVNATGTNTLVTTTSTTFSQSGTCDTIGANTFFSTTSQAFTQDGTATSPTQWTNEPANTTTWTNET